MVWYSLQEQVAQLKQDNAALADHVALLQERVDRLSSANPDLDYIDELVRYNLPLVHPGDQVIFMQWSDTKVYSSTF